MVMWPYGWMTLIPSNRTAKFGGIVVVEIYSRDSTRPILVAIGLVEVKICI